MKEFKFKISADISDLTGQFQAGAAELLKMVKAADKAEDKLSHLQEASSYLRQMDAALAKISNKYPLVFQQIFGKVDEQVKEALIPISNISGLIGQSINQVGGKLTGILSGVGGTADEFEEIASAMNLINRSIGGNKLDLDFLSGAGSSVEKAEQLMTALQGLMVTSAELRTSGGHVLFSTIGQDASNAAEQVRDLRKEIDELIKKEKSGGTYTEDYFKKEIGDPRKKNIASDYAKKQLDAFNDIYRHSEEARGKLESGGILTEKDYDLLVRYADESSKLNALYNLSGQKKAINVGSGYITEMGLSLGRAPSDTVSYLEKIRNTFGGVGDSKNAGESVKQEADGYDLLNNNLKKYFSLKKSIEKIQDDPNKVAAKTSEMSALLEQIEKEYELSEMQKKALEDELNKKGVGPAKARKAFDKIRSEKFDEPTIVPEDVVKTPSPAPIQKTTEAYQQLESQIAECINLQNQLYDTMTEDQVLSGIKKITDEIGDLYKLDDNQRGSLFEQLFEAEGKKDMENALKKTLGKKFPKQFEDAAAADTKIDTGNIKEATLSYEQLSQAVREYSNAAKASWEGDVSADNKMDDIVKNIAESFNLSIDELQNVFNNMDFDSDDGSNLQELINFLGIEIPNAANNAEAQIRELSLAMDELFRIASENERYLYLNTKTGKASETVFGDQDSIRNKDRYRALKAAGGAKNFDSTLHTHPNYRFAAPSDGADIAIYAREFDQFKRNFILSAEQLAEIDFSSLDANKVNEINNLFTEKSKNIDHTLSELPMSEYVDWSKDMQNNVLHWLKTGISKNITPSLKKFGANDDQIEDIIYSYSGKLQDYFRNVDFSSISQESFSEGFKDIAKDVLSTYSTQIQKSVNGMAESALSEFNNITGYDAAYDDKMQLALQQKFNETLGELGLDPSKIFKLHNIDDFDFKTFTPKQQMEPKDESGIHEKNAEAINNEAEAQKKLNQEKQNTPEDLVDGTPKIEEARQSIEKLMTSAREMQDIKFMSDFDIGSNKEKLTQMRAEFEKLATQAGLTEEEIQDALKGFNAAEGNLNKLWDKNIDDRRNKENYDQGYLEATESAYNEAESERQRLESENERLRSELENKIPQSSVGQSMEARIEEANNALREFKSLSDEIWEAPALAPESIGEFEERLNSLKNKLDGFANEGLINTDDMLGIGDSYLDSGRRLDKFREDNRRGQASYDNSVEQAIADERSRRVSAEMELEDANNKIASLEKQLAENKQKLSESPEVGATVGSETGDLSQLVSQVQSVTDAVNEKTAAFTNEGQVVSSVVAQEISALDTLSLKINEVTAAVNAKTGAFQSEGNAVSDSAKQASNNADKKKKEEDKPKKQGKPPKDNFEENRKKALSSFYNYFGALNGDFISDDAFNKLVKLEAQLRSITNNDDLDKWNKSWKANAKSIEQTVDEAETLAHNMQKNKLNGMKGSLLADFKATDINRDSMSDEQSRFVADYDQLVAELETYAKARRVLSKEEMAGFEQRHKALRTEAKTYKKVEKEKEEESYKVVDAEKEARKIAGAIGAAQYAGIDTSDLGAERIQRVIDAYDKLIAAQNSLGKDPTIEQAAEVHKLASAYQDALKQLTNLNVETQKLRNNKLWEQPVNNISTDDDREKALRDAIAKNTKGASNVKIGNISNDFKSLEYSIKNADGSWSHFIASINEAGTAVVGVNSKLKNTDSLIKRLATGSLAKFKNAFMVFSGYDLFYEGLEQLRRGIGYITEIDTALVELKKVTNETDEAYSQFLDTAAQIGSRTGSTMADITTMTAEWSKLG